MLDQIKQDIASELNNIEQEIYDFLADRTLLFLPITETPSWYPDMEYTGVTPAIFYDVSQNIYYGTYGPRNSLGKREYPVRMWMGQLDGSQPEEYYTTTQLAEYIPILERISDTEYRVPLNTLTLLPETPPFYLYFIATDGNGDLRITAISDEYKKVKVTAMTQSENDLVLTISPGIIFVPEDELFYYFGFYNRPVDKYIDQRLFIFLEDMTYENIVIIDSTNIVATEGDNIIYVDFLAGEEWENFTSVPYEILFMVRSEQGEILKTYRRTINKIVQSSTWQQIKYIDDVRSPEETPQGILESGELPPILDDPPELNIETIETWKRYKIYFTPSLPNISLDMTIHKYEETIEPTKDITDEELSVPLPSLLWSLRPLTFHSIEPLAPAVYANVYHWNWGYPLPYPERTWVDDCTEPVRKGYETPREFEQSYLNYDDLYNQWHIGTNSSFPICRNFIDSELVKECLIQINYRWFFKCLSLNNKAVAFHIHYKEW